MMTFKDFLGSVDSQRILDKIHTIMKRYLCYNYNIQCMTDDDEYHRYVDNNEKNMFVVEDGENLGVYSVYYKEKKVMTINFNKGVVA